MPIESEDRLTPNILKRVEQKYQPDRILVEYNGMWKLEKLMQAFPARWELYQIVTTVDATTFELYSNNIGPMMFEHITTADLVVFQPLHGRAEGYAVQEEHQGDEPACGNPIWMT